MTLSLIASDSFAGASALLAGRTLNNALGGTATVAWLEAGDVPGVWQTTGTGLAQNLSGSTSQIGISAPDYAVSRLTVTVVGGSFALMLRCNGGAHYFLLCSGGPLTLYNATDVVIPNSTLGSVATSSDLSLWALPGSVGVDIDGTTVASISDSSTPAAGQARLWSGGSCQVTNVVYQADLSSGGGGSRRVPVPFGAGGFGGFSR